MGTWGVGGFESDAALDWALEFEDANLTEGLNLIRTALNGDDDQLATAAAEMVIVINGHPVPEPPDTHHLDEMIPDEDDEDHEDDEDEEDEPRTETEIVAKTEAQTRELGMAIAEAIGRPGEVFVFEETEVFTAAGSIKWKHGIRVEEDEDEDEDDDEDWTNEALDWIERTHPASDPDLTNLARHAVARVTGPESQLAGEWFEEETEVAWRSYMAELAAKLAEPTI
jgi:hypothetical protein